MDSTVLPALPTYLFEPSLAGLLSLTLTIILPLLAALLMKASWPAFKKGITLLLIASVKAFVEAWIGHIESGEYFDLWRTLYAVLINYGIAVVFYAGLLKHTAVQQAALHSGVKDRRTIDGHTV